MTTVCAIYGYEFTREFNLAGMRFLPRYSFVDDVRKRALDLSKYHLTGIVVLDTYDSHQIFCLEAVLSFVEHLDVLISDPLTTEIDDHFSLFPDVARTAKRHAGGGSVLSSDSFFPEVRSDFIRLAMDRINDEIFCTSTGWGTLLFKSAATFRQRQPYIEVSYFLLFTGIETYVRRTLCMKDEDDITSPLVKRLRQLSFNIHNYRENDLKRSADSYVRLRNALFHSSAVTATRRLKDKSLATYHLVDYYTNFRILVNLVVLRAVGFDHPSINWDAWINMQY